MKGKKFNRMMRSTFGAFLKNLIGEPHVAKLIIRNGVGPKDDVFSIKEFIKGLIQERTTRKGEKRVAPEHAAELRRAAHFAREQFREGRRLAQKRYRYLDSESQILVDKYNEGTLAKVANEANKSYGIARTTNFGYTLGQNMRSRIPSDMLAALRCSKHVTILGESAALTLVIKIMTSPASLLQAGA